MTARFGAIVGSAPKALEPTYAIAVMAALILALPMSALACGVCIEDRIAAVYDHAVVTQALGQEHQVAFFAIDGTLPSGDGTRNSIVAMANSIDGVAPGSARVSVEAAALSIAFDPQRLSMTALREALQHKLASMKLSALPLRVIDGPAMMKTVGTE